MKRKIFATLSTLSLATGLLMVGAAPSFATANVVCRSSSYRGLVLVPTVSDGGSPNCYLIKGNTGDGVFALQRALFGCEGQSSLVLDSSFGPATQQALKNFQAAHGLVADGQYGRLTHNAMLFESEGYACISDGSF